MYLRIQKNRAKGSTTSEHKKKETKNLTSRDRDRVSAIDGEETVVSLAMNGSSSDDEDPEDVIAAALEDALGASADDPDIIEAKKRLLESKILSPDFFDMTNAPRYFSDDDEPFRHGESSREGEDEDEGDEGSGIPVPTETTHLVTNDGTRSSDILRPSIFTTVASIADQDHQDDA